MNKILFPLFLLLFLFLFSSISLAQVPPFINYQGVLRNAEGNPLDGIYEMTFSIYPSPEGGDPSLAPWSETHPAVEVINGLYSVQLGSGVNPTGNPIDPVIFDGQTKYLGVKIGNDQEMQPRVALVSVPYALQAGGIVGGNFVYFEPSNVQETQTDRGLWVRSINPTGVGVWGESSAGAGVYGRSDRKEEEAIDKEIAGVVGSGEGIGVFGQAKNRGLFGIGDLFGVYGKSNSSTGIGIYGEAKSSTGYGVYGDKGRYGVFGESQIFAVGGSGGSVGGSFEALAESGIGVYAKTIGNKGFSGYFEGGKGLFLDSDGKASATITLEKNSQQPDDPALDNSRIFIWKNYIVIQYTDGITGKTHYLYADLTSSGNWLHKGQLP